MGTSEGSAADHRHRRLLRTCAGRPCAECSCGRARPAAPACRGRHWQAHSRSHGAACADGPRTASWRAPPIRPNSAWKAFGVIGPSRSVMKTCDDSPARAVGAAERVSRHLASDGHSATRSWPCGHAVDPSTARPETIGRRVRRPASSGAVRESDTGGLCCDAVRMLTNGSAFRRILRTDAPVLPIQIEHRWRGSGANTARPPRAYCFVGAGARD